MVSCQDKCLSVQSPAQLNKFCKMHGKLYNQILWRSPEFAHAHIYLDSPRETGLKINQQYVIETSFHLMILNE